jgi:hypothetical protein
VARVKALEVLRRASELLDAYSVYEPEECDRAKMQRDAEALTRIITALEAAKIATETADQVRYHGEDTLSHFAVGANHMANLMDALAALEQE